MNKELHGIIEYVKSIRSRIEGVFEWLKGGTEITTTGQLRVTGAIGADVGFRARSSNGAGDVYTGVGSGGVNHGIYSYKLNKWLVHADSTYAYIEQRKLDLETNNTSDTWVPVLSGKSIQHRVIPTDKTKTLTGTTNGSGAIALGLSSSNMVRAVVCTSNVNYFGIPFKYNNTDWFAKIVDWQDLSSQNNKTVTLIVYYT